MTDAPNTRSDDHSCHVDEIATALADHGWCVTPGFLPAEATRTLAAEARQSIAGGGFRAAGTGRGQAHGIRPDTRGDQVKWLDPDHPSRAEQAYLARLEELRLTLNRQLFLGLFDFEGHLAVYPAGSFYLRHLDQFRGVGLRTVTTILYLNDDWTAADGGQLRLYAGPGKDEYQDILPTGGTLVSFLSADFEHEVLPAGRERLSLTGWFKIRGER